MATQWVEAFGDELLSYSVSKLIEVYRIAALLMAHGLFRTTELNEVHLWYLKEFIIIMLLHKSETDDEMRPFSEVFVSIFIKTLLFAWSESISESDVEVFGAQNEPFIEVNDLRHYSVLLLIEVVL